MPFSALPSVPYPYWALTLTLALSPLWDFLRAISTPETTCASLPSPRIKVRSSRSSNTRPSCLPTMWTALNSKDLLGSTQQYLHKIANILPALISKAFSQTIGFLFLLKLHLSCSLWSNWQWMHNKSYINTGLADGLALNNHISTLAWHWIEVPGVEDDHWQQVTWWIRSGDNA